MICNWVNDVHEFHEASALHEAPTRPTIPGRERRELCEDLIVEEYDELFRAIENDDLVEMADAAADLIYVVIWTCIEYGIPLDKVWPEVQRTNMAKIDATTGKVERKPNGKIAKPEGWTPPNIHKIIHVSSQ